MEEQANGPGFCKHSRIASQRVVLSKEGGKRRGKRERKKRERRREEGRERERDEVREVSRGTIWKGLISQVDEHRLFPIHDGKLVKGFKRGSDTFRFLMYKASSGRVTTLPLSSTAFWWHSSWSHA